MRAGPALLLLAGCALSCEPPPVPPAPPPPPPVRVLSKPRPPAPPPPTPAKLQSRYQSLTEATRGAMAREPPLAAATLQHILDLDERVQDAMALVLRDEGRRAGPQTIAAAQQALQALSQYLAGIP